MLKGRRSEEFVQLMSVVPSLLRLGGRFAALLPKCLQLVSIVFTGLSGNRRPNCALCWSTTQTTSDSLITASYIITPVAAPVTDRTRR